jgi:hypothetical protein
MAADPRHDADAPSTGVSPHPAGFPHARLVPQRTSTRLQRLDTLALGCLIGGLALALRARGNYAFAPWLGLGPTALLALWAPYRRHLGAHLRAGWCRLDRFSTEGGPLPLSPVLILVALPAFLLFLSNNDMEGSGDTHPVIPTAISLLSQGDTALDEYVRPARPLPLFGDGTRLPYFLVRRGEHVHSAYPAGMTALALPVVAGARLLDAELDDPRVRARLEKLAAAGITALVVAAFALIAGRLAPWRVALVATIILAAASGIFSTVAQGLWQHGGILLAMMVILLAEVASDPPGPRAALAQGLALGLLPAFRLTAISFAAPFGLWLLVRDPRRALRVGAIAALAFAPWAAWHWTIYGNPLGPSTTKLDGANWTAHLGWPLVGLLASPGRGLFVYQPWSVLGLLGLGLAGWRRTAEADPAALARQQRLRRLVPLLLLAVIGHLVLIAAWRDWHAGYSWGSRLVVEVVPLLALGMLPVLEGVTRRRSGRLAVAALVLVGVAMQLPAVYLHAYRWNLAVRVEENPASLWAWRDAPFLYPWTRGDRVRR